MTTFYHFSWKTDDWFSLRRSSGAGRQAFFCIPSDTVGFDLIVGTMCMVHGGATPDPSNFAEAALTPRLSPGLRTALPHGTASLTKAPRWFLLCGLSPWPAWMPPEDRHWASFLLSCTGYIHRPPYSSAVTDGTNGSTNYSRMTWLWQPTVQAGTDPRSSRMLLRDPLDVPGLGTPWHRSLEWDLKKMIYSFN